jgi:hypothetical protein
VVGAALGVVVVLIAGVVAAYSVGWLGQRHSQPLTTAQVIASVQPSVVTVKADIFRTGTSVGAGFIYGKPAHVLTTAQVVAKARKITVTGASGGTYEAGLLGEDRAGDLAELSIVDYSSKPLKPAMKPVAIGSDVMLVGNPTGGATGLVLSGKVRGTGSVMTVGAITYHNLIQTDLKATSGERGQPMINKSGELIGIVTVDITGSVFAIPVAGFDTEARSWAQSDTHIDVGPPLVKADASTLVIPDAHIPGGFQRTKSEPWTLRGHHVLYVKAPTTVEGGENIESYVIVELSEPLAAEDYQQFVTDAAATRTKQVSSGTGDESTTWSLLSGAQQVYQVVWRDRNVAAIVYWTAALPNSGISQTGAVAVASALEAVISTDLGAYTWPG